ncbi:hypothetical protein, partial [Aliibacillus thermotolerans]|uniref:hypothetical protein n=1 Tax=Aliibacillus thermotolerans TaxID=1834418 RepID=UPI0022EA483B
NVGQLNRQSLSLSEANSSPTFTGAKSTFTFRSERLLGCKVKNELLVNPPMTFHLYILLLWKIPFNISLFVYSLFGKLSPFFTY